MQTLKRGLLLLLAIGAIGCESAVEFPGAPFRSELVVTSEFSAESPWIVIVQRTVGFDEVVTFPVSVENATVTIEGNDGSRVELEHKGGGFYHSNCCRPQAGVTYRLQVEAKGFETVTAIDRLPEPTEIQDVQRSPISREGDLATRMEVSISDNGSTGNFYEVSMLLDERWREIRFTVLNAELQDQLNDYALGDIVEPDLSTIYVRQLLLHDKEFDGRAITLVLETDPFSRVRQIGGPVTVNVRTVSEAYYRYRRTRLLQKNTSKDPFAEPVEVRSNVKGGLGVFAGYAPETHGVLSDAVLRERFAGTFELTNYEVKQNGTEKYYVLQGGSGELRFQSDNTVRGNVSLPISDGESWSVSLDGGYYLRGRSVWFFHSAQTFFKAAEFDFTPDTGRLSASEYLDKYTGVYIRFGRKEDG